MKNADRVIGLFYEAAIAPEAWAEALVEVAEGLQCVDASIVVHDRATRQCVFGALGGRTFDPRTMALYQTQYARSDPLHKLRFELAAGTVYLSEDPMWDEDVRRNPFVQEILIPNGGGYIGGWILHNDSRLSAGLSLHRGKAPFGRQEVENWSYVAAHAGRAVVLGARLAADRARDHLLRQAIDLQGLTCIMVDDVAQVIDQSAAGAAALRSGSFLRQGLDGRIALATEAATGKLRALIAAACRGKGGGLLVIGTEGQASAEVQVVPAGVNRANPFDPRRGESALVFLKERRARRPADIAHLREVLDISLAKAEIAAALVAGRSPREIALDRGTSIHTVRAQIRALLAATGSRGIGALIARIAEI